MDVLIGCVARVSGVKNKHQKPIQELHFILTVGDRLCDNWTEESLENLEITPTMPNLIFSLVDDIGKSHNYEQK